MLVATIKGFYSVRTHLSKLQADLELDLSPHETSGEAYKLELLFFKSKVQKNNYFLTFFLKSLNCFFSAAEIIICFLQLYWCVSTGSPNT